MAIVFAVAVTSGLAHAEQDRYTLKEPNGLGFSDIKGYDGWQTVAVSQVEGGLKSIVANPAMIEAYKNGVPGKDTHFPDGATIVKIEWSVKKNPESPYFVMVPDTLKSVSFITKDSKRFPQTSGWGYAQFHYDAATHTFTPLAGDASFGKAECYSCHTAVAAKDYIFTAYPAR